MNIGTQMMPYMHEMDMTMMDTSYGSNSPEEEAEASEEVVIEEDIGVTEGQAHQHGDHSTEYWLQVSLIATTLWFHCHSQWIEFYDNNICV